MQLASSPAPTTSILLLTLLSGLTLVALVCWSILRRVRHSADSDHGAAGGAGKHALNRRRVAKPTRAVHTASKHSAAATRATASATSAPATREIASRQADSAEAGARQAQEDAAEADSPAQCSREEVAVPSTPSDLFRQHHAEHFQRAHQRLDRIRSQLAEQ